MTNNQNRQNESGNVLFLILIAVALFAALSYAVTQSTRSGSGTTERETILLNSASLTQYPTSLRTAVVRMVLAGLDIGQIGFDAPGSAGFGGASAANQVFHPQGGGAVFQAPPAEVMTAGVANEWTYNGNFEVPRIGQTGAGGNDLIAFLPGVTVGVCRRLNEELGVPSSTAGVGTYTNEVPAYNAANDNTAGTGYTFLLGQTFPTTAVAAANIITNDTGNDGDFAGQPAGCFYDSNFNTSGGYIFYSVLLER
jgi:hypothetical protein